MADEYSFNGNLQSFKTKWDFENPLPTITRTFLDKRNIRYKQINVIRPSEYQHNTIDSKVVKFL